MYQKLMLLGRAGEKPEIKTTPTGTAVCNFSVATKKSWKDKKTNQWQDETTWHKCVLWANHAEYAAKKVDKGSQVFIEGEIQNRSYEKDGQKKYITEVKVTNIKVFNNNSEMNKEMQKVDGEVNGGYATDDIPF